MSQRTREVVRRLGERAEEACRRYLSNGRKVGNYWIVGDQHNAKGRSLYVRLKPNGHGAAGKWTDAALGEHGDILDIVASAVGADRHYDALMEAERFLGMASAASRSKASAMDSTSNAARLFAAARPIVDTLAADYLRARGIDPKAAGDALRFHPRCYRHVAGAAREELPAMLAAVSDNDGRITGLMRTYFQRDASGCVHVLARRAMGALAGNGVRFGPPADVMAVGEGVETMLSLRMALPHISAVAALSAAHLAAFMPPALVQRLYIAVDNDNAGRDAAVRLRKQLRARSIEVVQLKPQRKDFNDDLIADGVATLRERLISQLADTDLQRLLARR